MTKEMIISSSPHETRVAILEDDQIAEIFIERERQRGVAGNLYKGRVSKVLPGMQSAFVDLGLERDGFLYVSDVTASTEEFDRLETEDDEPSSPATGNGAPELQLADDARGAVNETRRAGGRGPERGAGPGPGGPGRGGRRDRDRDRDKGPEPKIEELLKEGQEIIVQVGKEPRSEEHTSELQSRLHLVCRLLLEK